MAKALSPSTAQALQRERDRQRRRLDLATRETGAPGDHRNAAATPVRRGRKGGDSATPDVVVVQPPASPAADA